jgi:hypothetical protein
MIYIEGLGYVEEPTSVVMPSSQVKSQATDGTSFDDVLNNITSTSSGTTYTMKEIFQKAASTYGIDESLLEAVAYRESSFNANATSSAGAQGIMQLMPDTAKDLGITDAYDAYQNIMGGAKYLKWLYDRYNGDLSLTLAAYNAGYGAVDRAGGVPSTGVQNFVTSVMSLYQNGVNVPDITVTTNAASETNTDSSNNNSNTATAADTTTAVLTGSAGSTGKTGSSQSIQDTQTTQGTSGTTYIDAATLESALTSVLGTQSSVSVSSASELAAQVMAALGGTNSTYGISSDWTSQEYQLMLQYYSNMLSTISSFGDTDDDDDDYGESSLADLYQLGIQQQLGLNSTSSTSTTSTATASAIAQAAKAYAAGNSLLDL